MGFSARFKSVLETRTSSFALSTTFILVNIEKPVYVFMQSSLFEILLLTPRGKGTMCMRV